MKILKKILLVVLILVAIPLIIALFVKNDYTVEREVTINKPTPDVFNYLKYLKNQDNYSKWVMTDPGMKKVFTGTDGTVGFVYAWDSQNKNAGKGEQEIKNLSEGKEVDTEVRFEKPMESVAHMHMSTNAAGNNQTMVKWAVKGNSKYPMNFMNLFMNSMLGNDMETSLGTLKNILEK